VVSSDAPANRPGALALILKVGLVAGTLDIADALIFSYVRGVMPVRLFQYIASGLIGTRSFQLGLMSVALGAVLHYVIALAWTTIFYVAARRFAILLRRPLISGALYGLAVYLFMNWVVLPLSAVPHPIKSPALASRINGVLAVVLFIGVAISLLIRRNTPAQQPINS
jgi:hypothetical protein